MGFCDSDDTLEQGAIQAWLDTAYREDADIVDGSFNRVTTEGKTISTFTHKTQYSFSGFIWTRVFKAYLFENIQFPEKYWFEDSVVGLIIPHAKKYVAIPHVVYNYTTNPQSITHTSRGNLKSIDSFYVTRALMEDASKLDYFDLDADYSIDFFLKQFQITWQRTHSLGIDLESAIYTLTRHLFLKYFPNTHTKKESLKLLENAIREDDFTLYRRECLLMK